jgi:replication factor C small subunit
MRLWDRHIIAKLKNWLARKTIPHLLLTGTAGVGKTSTAVAFAKELWGDDWKYNLHVFNASDDRGIGFIRGDVQTLVGVAPVDADFQIIFLDEADELTNDAQGALREIMQKHTDTTKFILACNFPHKIIKPIKDRCAVLRYSRLSVDDISKKLIEVCGKEGITYDDGVMPLLAKYGDGSLRKAIQGIETFIDVNNHIGYDLIHDDVKFLEVQDIRALLKKAFSGDVDGYETQLFSLYYEGGFCVQELLNSIITEINAMRIDPSIKQGLIIQTAKYDWRVSQGSNDLLQARCYLATLQGILNKTIPINGYID